MSPRGAPSVHELRAAARVAGLLSCTPVPRETARASYRSITGGILRSDDLVRGEMLLAEANLALEDDTTIALTETCRLLALLPEADAIESILTAWLLAQRPLWLVSATSPPGHLAWEYVPDDVRQVLDVVFTSAPDLQAAFVEGAASKVDPERDAETGRLAEEAVVEAARQQLLSAGHADLAASVQQVSLINDRAGYDIAAPRSDRTARHLEVKGTRSVGSSITVYVSRNEARRAAADPDWSLVLCSVDEMDQAQIHGWCAPSGFLGELPVDQPGRARWASATLTLKLDSLTPGLPPI